MCAAGVTVLVAALSFPFLGAELLPRFKEYDFPRHWVETPGASLDSTLLNLFPMPALYLQYARSASANRDELERVGQP
jgi:Cu/Ag efflux pump CusA